MTRRTRIGTYRGCTGPTGYQVSTRILHTYIAPCQLTMLMFITTPSTLRPLTRLSTVGCPRQYIWLGSASDIGQTQRFRRWYSANTVEPPAASGHLTSVASSQLLRSIRESAFRTPGLTWTDEDDSGTVRSMVGGRETRKMNMYQAVRDALRYGGWLCPSALLTRWQHCTRKR